MIKAILVFNNHGKPRLSKFYQYYVSFWKRNRIYVRSMNQISYKTQVSIIDHVSLGNGTIATGRVRLLNSLIFIGCIVKITTRICK